MVGRWGRGAIKPLVVDDDWPNCGITGENEAHSDCRCKCKVERRTQIWNRMWVIMLSLPVTNVLNRASIIQQERSHD
eukprot:scaffold252082_cov17-Prasinocladus_malaysianus.AAC.1